MTDGRVLWEGNESNPFTATLKGVNKDWSNLRGVTIFYTILNNSIYEKSFKKDEITGNANLNYGNTAWAFVARKDNQLVFTRMGTGTQNYVSKITAL